MARLTFELVGDREFKMALQDWDDDTFNESSSRLDDILKFTRDSIRRQYVRGATGNLQRGVSIRREHFIGRVLSGRVRSAAPHAHLYEFGTRERFHRSGKSVGSMPSRPVFIPSVIRARQAYAQQVRSVLSRPAPKIGPGRPDVYHTGGGLL